MKLFSVNEANIAHLKDCIEEFGKAWIHGNGNVYVDEQSHGFARDFSPLLRMGEAGSGAYWAFFDDVDDVPESVDALKKIFLKNREKAVEASTETKQKTEFKVLKSKAPVLENKNPETDKLIKAAAILDTKDGELKEKETTLAAREDSLTQWHETLSNKTEAQQKQQAELEAKEKELADRERKVQAQLEKLRASQGAKNPANPAGQ